MSIIFSLPRNFFFKFSIQISFPLKMIKHIFWNFFPSSRIQEHVDIRSFIEFFLGKLKTRHYGLIRFFDYPFAEVTIN